MTPALRSAGTCAPILAISVSSSRSIAASPSSVVATGPPEAVASMADEEERRVANCRSGRDTALIDLVVWCIQRLIHKRYLASIPQSIPAPLAHDQYRALPPCRCGAVSARLGRRSRAAGPLPQGSLDGDARQAHSA